MVEGRYGHGILAHQDLEPNSNYFGSYEIDKWSLHFGSTLPEVLRLNSHNFRIRSPNQENSISTDNYRKSYTRIPPTLSGTRVLDSSNSACKIVVLPSEVSARFSEYLFLSIAAIPYISLT